MEKRKALIDVPVAMIFFNRPEQFKRVFETVKEAAPTKLFLIQDGARPNRPSDSENIEKCREIIKGIDWECEVHTNFSDENLGCGKRIYTGVTWCFEYVDRLIILEDDCLPSLSFFPFCKEILEKYKDDQRIGRVTGMNHLNTFDKIDADYLFSKEGCISGWATWKRAWSFTDFDLTFAEDENAMRLLRYDQKYGFKVVYNNVLKRKKQLDNGEKLTSWSTQFDAGQVLNSTLYVVPKVNLMSNIGITAEATNNPTSIKMVPHGLRPLYRLKLYEMDFPLKHPKYVIDDIEYGIEMRKLMRPNKLVKICRKTESVFLRLIHGDGKNLLKSLKRKLGIR